MAHRGPNIIQKDIFVKVIQNIGFIKRGELNTGFFGMSQQACIKQTLQLEQLYVVDIARFRTITAEKFETVNIEAWA